MYEAKIQAYLLIQLGYVMQTKAGTYSVIVNVGKSLEACVWETNSGWTQKCLYAG